MFFSADLNSRIKELRYKRRRRLGSVADKTLIGWSALIFFTAMSLVAVSTFSFYRFVYWSNMDYRLTDSKSAETYDEEKLEAVLQEFDTKADRAKEILSTVPVAEEVATTTATSSEEMVE